MTTPGNGLKWFKTSAKSDSLHAVEIEKTNSDATLSWSGPSYIVGMGMIQVFRNGNLLNSKAYRELTGNSIEYLDISANPIQLGDIFSIRYIPGNVNLGEVIVRDSLEELEATLQVINGTVAITTNDKSFWVYKIDTWHRLTTPLVAQSVGMVFDSEEQSIHKGRIYTLSKIAYGPGLGDLMIFVDGVKVSNSIYTESNQNTITFDRTLIGEEVQFIVGNSNSWKESLNNHVFYKYNDQDQKIRERVELEDGTIVQDTHYFYDSNTRLEKEVVSRSGKTIIKSYRYDARGNIASCKTIVA